MDNFRGFIPTKYMSTKYFLKSECAHADVANMTIQIDLYAHFYPRFLEKQLFSYYSSSLFKRQVAPVSSNITNLA